MSVEFSSDLINDNIGGGHSDSSGCVAGVGRFDWIAAALCAAMVGGLTYANSVFNDYCYDSVQIVQENPMVNEPGHWIDLWQVDHWYQNSSRVANRDLLYRPVALLSYRFVRVMAGSHPFWQHVANVLLHAANCALLVMLARRLGLSLCAAIVAGLFFAVMPIHSEVIDDIVGRSDLMVTFGVAAVLLVHFRLVEIWSYNNQTHLEPQMATCLDSQPVSSAEVKSLASSKWSYSGWMTTAAIGVFSTIGAKESGVSVLLIVPLLDVFWFRTCCGNRFGQQWWSIGTLIRLSYLWPPFILYILLRVNALDGVLLAAPSVSKTVNVLVDASTWQHILGVLQLWGMYWAKMVFPLTLCVDYSINAVQLPTSIFEFNVLLGVGLILTLIGLAAFAWKRGRPAAAILLVALVISYGPTANAFAIIQVYFAERLWYWPSMWASMLVGLAISTLVRGRLGFVLVGIALALFMTRSWVRNAQWKDNGTVAAAAYAVHPDSVLTLAMYGNWLVGSAESKRGIGLLERAAEIDPGFTVAHRALGEAYFAVGKLRKSLDHLQKAELQFPGEPRTRKLLESISDQLSRTSQPQLLALKERADRNPNDLDAELNYVRALANFAMYDDVLARLIEKGDQFSSQAAWQIEYARTFVLIGRVDDAIERYRRSVALDATSSQCHAELAAMLMQRQQDNDINLAGGHLDTALELANGSLPIRTLKAEWLILRGKIDEARKIYAEVLRLAPQNHPQFGVWKARAKALGVQEVG